MEKEPRQLLELSALALTASALFYCGSFSLTTLASARTEARAVMLSALHKCPQHLALLGTAAHVLTASTYVPLLPGRPEVVGSLHPWEKSSTNNP